MQAQPLREAVIENSPVMALLADAKVLAQKYRALTGKPLGITGEVAEYEASRILGVELTPARQAGYDAVLLVLLDENFNATSIYEAEREDVLRVLAEPGSKSRNERGALGVSKFKSIARLRWQRSTSQ
jgi:hypothetical protein